jgi:hypothetical protein
MKVRFNWLNFLLRNSRLAKDDGRPRPVIVSSYGETSEVARLAAALNMRDDPDLRKRIVDILAVRYGSQQAGENEARRRYPEAFR